MRLLVVDGSTKERDATLRLLSSDTYEVRVAKDAAEALICLETHEFDLILIESKLPSTSGCELVKRIRAREYGTHVYIIMTAREPAPGDVRIAFLVGADDFIRKPMARDELIARLEGPTRIRRWASKLLAAGACTDNPFTSMTAWTSVEQAVCSELTDMLGFVLTPMASPQAIDAAVHVAQLPFTLSSEHLEISLAVGVDDATAAALAEAMFGSAEVEAAAIKDMMREVANVAGGAFKRLAATEGRALTTGMPCEADPEQLRHANAAARKQWICHVEGTAVALRFELELRPTEMKRIRVAGLREGMVLATEVRNPAGGLLVPSGTRITESNLGGLVRTLGVEASVEVLEAA